MKTSKYIFFIIGLSLVSYLSTAQTLKGVVLDKANNQALIGAGLKWQNAQSNGTSTDENGNFSLTKHPENHQLIVSYIGYRTDTLMVHSLGPINIYLIAEGETLNEVTVRSQSTVIDKLSPIHTEIITSKSLAKAACCNLSESFETNASVSVNYTDAVTGAKQIQMLGLAGTYIQMNTENIPSLRGLASTFGLNYIPGSWVQSIDVGKGTGSVVNGYESMTGAINVELKKPELSEKIYLNTYLNSFGRGEINLNLANKLNKRWSVGLLSHGSALQTKIDKNGDGFLDLPLTSQVNLINRWKYASDKMMAQFGVKFLSDNRQGGQTSFKNNTETPLSYGFSNHTNRVEFFSKTAKLYQAKPYRGLGFILNGTFHDSKSMFGFKPYNAQQKSLYANLIYQDILGNTNHTYKAGLSYLLDDYSEQYAAIKLARIESIHGAFAEYTYNNLDKTVIVAGARVDFNSLYGKVFTPRLHIKQDLNENTTLRFSVGKGFRVANPLAEYFGNLASSRQVVFLEKINPEVAWNYGLSLTKTFGKSSLVLDVYRTDFKNQLIADLDHTGYLYFYNLEGKSYANSAQIELNLVPVDRFEIKLAYRYFNVKQSIGKPLNELVLVDKMFVNRDRVLVNLGYALPYDKWKADLTIQWNGKRRIAEQKDGYVHDSYKNMPIVYAPAFYNINAQITRTFIKWDIYLGGENLSNFTQKNPIMHASMPFDNRFDAGMAWGPVVGRMIYLGMRYKL